MEAEKPEIKKKSSKWTALIIGALILIVLIGSYLAYTNFFVGKSSLPAKTEVVSNITGELAGLNPSDVKALEGWTLTKAQALTDMSSVAKGALNKSGVTDLAIWEFNHDNESLKFQILKYDSNESVSAAESDAVRPFGTTPWVLDVGPQKGIVGAYTSSSGNNPLALYFTQDNYVFFISYYNQNGEYNATSFKSDEEFLRYIGERTLTKLSS